jgi:AraC-like DNA-binding protein
VEAVVFDSDDLAAIEDFFVRAYTRVRIDGVGERARARVDRTGVGSITLDRLRVGFDMSYAADPVGRVCLRLVRTGRIDERLDGSPECRFGAGEIAVLMPDRPVAGNVLGAEYDVVMFPPELFRSVAGIEGNGGVRLTGQVPRSPAHAQRLQHLVHYLYALAEDPTVRPTPLMARAAEVLLAAAVLETFPNTLPTEPTEADRRDAHPGTLRRVIAFVEAEPGREITPAEMAAAAGVGLRAVQLAFRRHLGTTPTAWLRQVRLAAAHRELLAADPTRTTVASIAARWGFPNPGRFAAAHRASYGGSPSDALRFTGAGPSVPDAGSAATEWPPPAACTRAVPPDPAQQ